MSKNILVTKTLLILSIFFSILNTVSAKESINLYTLDDYNFERASTTLSEDSKDKILILEEKISNSNPDKQIELYKKIYTLLEEWYLYENKYSEQTKYILIYLRSIIWEQLLENDVLKSSSLSKFYNNWEQELWEESKTPYQRDFSTLPDFEKNNRTWLVSDFRIPNKIWDYIFKSVTLDEYDNAYISYYEYEDSLWRVVKLQVTQYLPWHWPSTRNSIEFCSEWVKNKIPKPLKINSKIAYQISTCNKNYFYAIMADSYYVNTLKYIYISYWEDLWITENTARKFMYNILDSKQTKRELRHNDFIVNTELIDWTIYIQWKTSSPEAVSYTIWREEQSGLIDESGNWKDTFSWLTSFNISFYNKNGEFIYYRFFNQANDLSTITYNLIDEKLYISWKVNDTQVKHIKLRYMKWDLYITVDKDWKWKSEINSPEDTIFFYSEVNWKKIKIGERDIYPILSN